MCGEYNLEIWMELIGKKIVCWVKEEDVDEKLFIV